MSFNIICKNSNIFFFCFALKMRMWEWEETVWYSPIFGHFSIWVDIFELQRKLGRRRTMRKKTYWGDEEN